MFCLHVCLCESVESPGTSCELLYGFWELNPGPPEEQPVLLTAEPSLHLECGVFKHMMKAEKQEAKPLRRAIMNGIVNV